MAIVSFGNSSHERSKPSLRLETVNHKNQTKSDGFYATNYDAPLDDTSTQKYGFRSGKKSFRFSEIGTTV